MYIYIYIYIYIYGGAARAGWAAELNARGQASSPEARVKMEKGY